MHLAQISDIAFCRQQQCFGADETKRRYDVNMFARHSIHENVKTEARASKIRVGPPTHMFASGARVKATRRQQNDLEMSNSLNDTKMH